MRRLICGTVLALLFATTAVYAQGGGGGGGGGGGMRGMGGGFGLTATDPVYNMLVTAVADCNLDPAFTLSADQKTTLKKVRDDFKAAQTKWTTDHTADMQKIQQEMQDARGAGGDMQAIMQKMTDLRATQPKSDDAQAAIKKLLTPDQLKAVEAKVTELQAAQPGRGGRGGGGGGGGFGGGGGGGGGGI